MIFLTWARLAAEQPITSASMVGKDTALQALDRLSVFSWVDVEGLGVDVKGMAGFDVVGGGWCAFLVPVGLV